MLRREADALEPLQKEKKEKKAKKRPKKCVEKFFFGRLSEKKNGRRKKKFFLGDCQRKKSFHALFGRFFGVFWVVFGSKALSQ